MKHGVEAVKGFAGCPICTKEALAHLERGDAERAIQALRKALAPHVHITQVDDG